MSLCQEAHGRKLATGRAQILVLYELEPPGLDEAGTVHSDIVPVSVCKLEKITHADLLHGLASGFDVIYLQACSAPQGKDPQRLEVDLVRALGGLGRILLFNGAAGLDRRLAARLLPFPSVAPEVLAVGSRRDTARASAAALLPASTGHAELPDQAPYGSVSLDEDLCNSCNSCVWVCPSDALSLTESGGALSFVESLCTQCGLCVSICPQRALSMMPGMDLTAYAVLPHLLAGEGGQMEPTDAGGAAAEDPAAMEPPPAETGLPFAEVSLTPVPETRHTGRV
ncbi:4Fe-4S binding protein [Leisingera sp. S132]|uniref:ATP-binding protein n=1 Tax=Leisingera sp. S132 TaxID=2867016 RepID=UPI0021A49386|nr:4Fe-4S binding protein [Leisingera sp. S132]UWQ81285.1 4Fe-4S binding protein [Leisingera sp. S132]